MCWDGKNGYLAVSDEAGRAKDVMVEGKKWVHESSEEEYWSTTSGSDTDAW